MISPASLLPRISDYVSWHAARRPDAPALCLKNARIDYAELARRIDALAKALLAAGIRKGDRVATLQTPHPDYVVVLLASASIGAVWMGLNPRYQPAELRKLTRHAQPRILLMRTLIEGRCYSTEDLLDADDIAPDCRIVVFGGDPPLPETESMPEFLLSGDAISDVELQEARAGCGGRDPCLIVYTSGSSGAPKGALLHHAGIAAVSHAQNASWDVDPYRIVNYFPINHVGCVVECTLPCLVAGGSLHFMEHFNARACLKLMQDERISIWGGVPSAFQLQLQIGDFAQFDLSAVRLIAWGGAGMPEALIRRLSTICPRLSTNYGMTESCGIITAVDPTDDIEVLANTVGFADPEVEVRLVDAEGNAVAEGIAGEVRVRSNRNLVGYWRDETRNAFTAEGFFRTGDLALMRADGRYSLVGRLGDMYKSGGYNVYPGEIETVLEAHPAVTRAAVVSVTDPLWQEIGVAYAVAKPGVTAAQLESHCRAHLAAYKVPKRILLLTELPLLPIGKVDKAALRRNAAEPPP